MHEPGPPRFVAVGEAVELAPRNPVPGACYEWHLVDAPSDSDATVGDDAVERLVPDVPGPYRLELDAPDGRHVQRVRVFPDLRDTARFEADADLLPDHDPGTVHVVGPWNEWIVGADHPEREGDAYVFERDLPPGEHEAVFLAGEDFENGVRRRATVEGPQRPRVRVDAWIEGEGADADTESDAEVVVTADPRPAPDSDAAPADLDIEFVVDDRDDPVDLQVDGNEARVPLDAVEESVRVHAVAVDERHSVADLVQIDADGTIERPNEPPEWIEGATMYEIFTRSFVGSAGTTFDRLADRVPYLEWMGVDAVWLTPVLAALSPILSEEAPGGPHGYDTIDYFDVAEDLGTRAEFEAFVERCHEAGIRVIFDLVVNHTSAAHPHHQLSAAGVEAYRDWYVWRDADEVFVPAERREAHAGDVAAIHEHYFNWWSLPNLNYESLAVRRHVLDVVSEWAEVVDGFRCDVAWGVDHGVWKEIHDRVRATDEDFFLLDETIPRDPDFGESEFDAHYDTTLYHRLREIGRGEAHASDLLEAVRAREREGFPPDSIQMCYVENHDEDRYVDECGRAPLRAAAAATFTLPGLPMIYYGQESGLEAYRGDMNWTTGDDALRRFHRRLVAARDDHPVLVEGRVDPVEVAVEDGEADRVVAYARESGDERVVVVLHFGEGEATVALDERHAATDLLTGETVSSDGDTVPVEDALVLESTDSER